MFQIEYIEISNKKPFKEFLNTLKISEIAKIINSIDYFLELKNNNLIVKENISKHLENGIFELRIHLDIKISRVCYYYLKGQKIVITHGFIKKTQKTPVREIQRAIKLREQYNKRMNYDKL